eukprot:c23890_g1_i1 orf=445-708(+)
MAERELYVIHVPSSAWSQMYNDYLDTRCALQLVSTHVGRILPAQEGAIIQFTPLHMLNSPKRPCEFIPTPLLVWSSLIVGYNKIPCV